jgi:hypothetical protein
MRMMMITAAAMSAIAAAPPWEGVHEGNASTVIGLFGTCPNQDRGFVARGVRKWAPADGGHLVRRR